jgi:protein-tyrosine phosphatase
MTAPLLSYADLDHGLFLGACPRSPEDITHLASELGVATVLNLQTDEDLRSLGIRWQALWAAYTRQGIEVIRVPIPDLNDRALRDGLGEAVSKVVSGLEKDRPVYVHCTAGVNRSPTVVIAVLAGHLGLGFHKALSWVQQKRSVSPAVSVIQDWLKE